MVFFFCLDLQGLVFVSAGHNIITSNSEYSI